MRLFSEQKPHIAVVGSSDLELSLPVPHLPEPGDSVFAEPVSSSPGGRAADICRALSTLGSRVFLFSCVGLDPNGARILNQLRQFRVNTDFIERSDHPTGMVLTLKDPGGGRIRVIAPGSGLHMTKDPLSSGKAMISSCQLGIVLADISEEAFLFSIRIFHHYGIPVLAIPSPAHRFNRNWIGLADILLAGTSDTAPLTKIKPASLGMANEALNHFIQRGCGAAALYLGRFGAAVSEEVGGARFFPSPRIDGPVVPEAEDVFTAALAYSLASGNTLDEACTFAVAAAFTTHSRPDTKFFPTPAHVMQALRV